jgi:hypothetical protein
LSDMVFWSCFCLGFSLSCNPLGQATASSTSHRVC